MFNSRKRKLGSVFPALWKINSTENYYFKYYRSEYTVFKNKIELLALIFGTDKFLGYTKVKIYYMYNIIDRKTSYYHI